MSLSLPMRSMGHLALGLMASELVQFCPRVASAVEDANDIDKAGLDAVIDEMARELGDGPPVKFGQRNGAWAEEASGGGIASNLPRRALDRYQEAVRQRRCGVFLQILMQLKQVGNRGFTKLEPGQTHRFAVVLRERACAVRRSWFQKSLPTGTAGDCKPSSSFCSISSCSRSRRTRSRTNSLGVE